MSQSSNRRLLPASRVRASLGLLLVLWLALPAGAAAHSALQRSTPAAGDTLSAAPEALRLTFDRAVDLAFARLRLVGPDGADVPLAPLALASDSERTLLGRLAGPLTAAGEYVVHWQIVSADGHPVRGEYSFAVAPGALGLAPEPPAEAVPPADAAPVPVQEPAPSPAAFDTGSPLYVAVRWLTFVGLLGAIGAVAFRFPVLSLVRRRQDAAGRAIIAPAARRAAGVGAAAAGVLLIALVLRLFAQSFAVYGAGPLAAERLAPLLTQTLWGWGWLLQAVGGALALTGFAMARSGSRAGWGAAVLGTVVLGFSPALSGHAAAAPAPAIAVLADGLHVLGAGGWLGSLLLVVAVGVPAALRLETSERSAAVRALVNAFSPTALAFAAVVVATGVFASWLHLQSISALWESAYGRTLLWKLAALSGVFAAGAYNWLRVRPALQTESAARHLRRSAALELTAGVLVLAITAVLVATPPPQETAEPTPAATASR